MQTIAQPVKRRSTIAIDVAFLDQDGQPVAPTTASWTLTRLDGTVINGRAEVAIETPGTTETIVLSGDDTDVREGLDSDMAELLIEAVIDGDLGEDLPFNDAVRIPIESLAGIGAAVPEAPPEEP